MWYTRTPKAVPDHGVFTVSEYCHRRVLAESVMNRTMEDACLFIRGERVENGRWREIPGVTYLSVFSTWVFHSTQEEILVVCCVRARPL